jgi:hypothetical protein
MSTEKKFASAPLLPSFSRFLFYSQKPFEIYKILHKRNIFARNHQIKKCLLLKAAFQLRVFHTRVHARKS